MAKTRIQLNSIVFQAQKMQKINRAPESRAIHYMKFSLVNIFDKKRGGVSV